MNDWARQLLDQELLTGCARYDDHAPGDASRRIVVQARLGSQPGPVLTWILDTGAPWNVVRRELLETLRLQRSRE